MGNVDLDRGIVMLGALSLCILLFADDVGLVGRSLGDVQRFLSASGGFCECSHEEVD